MGLRRSMLEVLVCAMRRAWRFRAPQGPRSIFVLRNNDLGDVAVITPLFEALRRSYPEARIVAGVLSGSEAILEGNPYLSAVVACNAPWHNHKVSKKNLRAVLRYIFFSAEAARLTAERFDVGIDVTGSAFGSMLLMRMGIPVRLGRKGYAGGHTGATAYLEDISATSVAKNAIEFVRLLQDDADLDIAPKPQLFLREAELAEARKVWTETGERREGKVPRIIFAPGAGLPQKQWPAESFVALARRFAGRVSVRILGSAADAPLGEAITSGQPQVRNLCGQTSIRQSMALIATADLVVCHGSFVMHVAAAFHTPAVVILTRLFDPKLHAVLWEVEGLHHQMFPQGDEAQVSVDAVEEKIRELL